MKQEQTSGKRKKLLFLLLLMLIPATVLVFLFMNLRHKKVEVSDKTGINTTLPNSPKETLNPLDKLSVYLQADKDSIKREEQIRKDPYYQQLQKDNEEDVNSMSGTFNPFNVNNDIKKPLYPRPISTDANEVKVKQKLAELERQLSSNMSLPPKKDTVIPHNFTFPVASPSKTASEDPEIEQLNSMLEKVLDIQHPQRVTEKLQATSLEEKSKALRVQNKQEENIMDCLMPTKETENPASTTNRFYESGYIQSVPEENAIAATIHQTETIIPGATIKIRLNQDMYINNTLIPKGTFVFGLSTLQGDRLKIAINTVTFHNSIYPVDLSVYSLDGMEGVLIPGAISREVAKESAAQTANGIQMSMLDPSVTAQATAAGVQAVKSLITRKAKVVQVTVKAGAVLLRSPRSN